MGKKLFRLLFVFTVAKLVLSQENYCLPNEVLGNTVNPCGTCDQRGSCPEETEEVCDCAPGFFKNNQELCVTAEECAPVPPAYGQTYPRPPPSYPRPPPSYPSHTPRPAYPPARPTYPPPRPIYPPECPQNEEFSKCGVLPECDPTCENPSPICSSTDCVPGCFCRRGFVKRDGRCIALSSCPSRTQCPVNEVFTECGSACPVTCVNGRPIRQQVCPAQCVRGCFCRPGYIRDSGVCVPRKLCRPVTPAPTPGPTPAPTPAPTTEPPTTTTTTTSTTTTAATPTPGTTCPNRQLCAASCINRGFRTGFCVGPRFLRCSCF